jgi:hypothetical protein
LVLSKNLTDVPKSLEGLTIKMQHLIKRRDFMRFVSISGLSFAISNPLKAGLRIFEDNVAQIKNQFCTISFDHKQGRFNITQSHGDFLIRNATVRANTPRGKKSITDSNYEHSVDHKIVSDKLGNGQKLIVHSKDLNAEIDFETHFSLYENWNNIIIEALCKNVSSKDLNIHSIEPICATEEAGALMQWSDFSKILTNGAMYYDAGKIHDINFPYKEPEPYGPTKGGAINPDFKYPSENRIRSWWNIGFFRGYEKDGLVCGFVDNANGLGQLVVSKTNSNDISLHTESVFSPGFTLKPGGSIGSNRFMINIADNPYSSLETYSQVMGILNSGRVNSIVNGWCSWFYTFDHVNEDEVIRNAEFVSRNLKRFGLEYIQIDEGFQRFHGDWEGNEKFPHGMKWLADKIKSYGLKPGLWLAPYVVSEPTEIFQRNPDWFLKHSDGRLMRVGPWPSEDTEWAQNENPKRYGLDITHPDAAKWLYNLFDKIANQWGYEMFKIDFVAWSLLSAHHYFDQSVTPAQAYRQGMEIIRSAIGPERHINECGPGSVSVGLIDSMRIEIDQNYGYSKAAWQQYFLESSSSAPAAAKRYYFHKKTWVNDADHVCINLLPTDKAQAAASLIALSGGNIISGDRLTELDHIHLDILKKIFPSFGEAAQPVDLFDNDRHSVFAVKIKKPFAEWTVAGFFNSSETEIITKSFPLSRLWLDPTKIYLGYDFWNQKLFGEIKEKIQVSVFPSSVTLLSLHENTGSPQFLSTDRHVLQGAHELENVEWNSENKTLSGLSIGVIGTSHKIAVYSPEAQYWTQSEKVTYHDFENYTLKLVDEHIVRVHVKFDKSEKVSWHINFKDSFR